MLEAMASGLPVAAFPVTGPRDVITDARAGVLDEDLRKAALAALKLSRDDARAFTEKFSWETSAKTFRSIILEANGYRERSARQA